MDISAFFPVLQTFFVNFYNFVTLKIHRHTFKMCKICFKICKIKLFMALMVGSLVESAYLCSKMCEHACMMTQKQKHRLGSIEFGKVANMTVFDCDFLHDDIEKVARASIVATIVDGKEVFKA